MSKIPFHSITLIVGSVSTPSFHYRCASGRVVSGEEDEFFNASGGAAKMVNAVSTGLNAVTGVLHAGAAALGTERNTVGKGSDSTSGAPVQQQMKEAVE